MNDKNEHSTEGENAEDETLKRFDMYRFFSRKDVIFAISFLVMLLVLITIKTLFTPVVA